ncbi:hypothetical protein IFM89_010262 [Coptis chinensis]|uniref:Uncharacterized protein n=1 Tax=Coptis chinensis TaxID=261450 RepID=A0A835HPU2_9MAGN|nr:hypothetical protein IFM89_010262 [Coptis chinensis]
MDDSILIKEVGEREEYGLVPEPSTTPSAAFSFSVQPLEFEVEVEIMKPPCLGMCFETLEAAKQFYIDYIKSFGFSPLVYEAVETDSAYQLMLQRLQELSVELKKQKEVDPDVELEDEDEKNDDEDGEKNEDEDTNDDNYD